MHYDIEDAHDLEICFPADMQNFSDEAGKIIFEHLQERFADCSITDDNIAPYAEHETLAELCNHHDINHAEALRSIYDQYATAEDYPAPDAEDETCDFDDLTETRQGQFAEEYGDDIRQLIEKRLAARDITLWSLPNGCFLTWDENA